MKPDPLTLVQYMLRAFKNSFVQPGIEPEPPINRAPKLGSFSQLSSQIPPLRNSLKTGISEFDTVPRPPIDGVKITTLSVAGYLGEAIKRIPSNSSVNSLFEFKGERTS
jgi:hypothetical protein